MKEFLEELASAAPTPGGGGASAQIGAVSAALCSMVANLTTGKKKYAEYQQELDTLLITLEDLREESIEDIQRDAQAFYPLSQAYAIKKEDPKREAIMEQALRGACEAPMKIVCDVSQLVPILERLETIGSRLAISDVAVAAAACEAALKGAVMNIFINTKSMKDRETAEAMNSKAKQLCEDGSRRCEVIYKKITEAMF